MTQSNLKAASAYTADFEFNLQSAGVYLATGPPATQKRPLPANMSQLEGILGKSRSLSPTRYTDEFFQEFQTDNTNAFNETVVRAYILPKITGKNNNGIPFQMNVVFNNLQRIHPKKKLVMAKPDWYSGINPSEIGEETLENLGPVVVPSKHLDLPCLPNLFVEVKGPDGLEKVSIRQAGYDAALGARGIHHFRQFIDPRPASLFDSSALTISAVLSGGHATTSQLTFFATHCTRPTSALTTAPVEYHMTRLKQYNLSDDLGGFQRGFMAFRNVRDWTSRVREDLVRRANNKLRDLGPPPPLQPVGDEEGEQDEEEDEAEEEAGEEADEESEREEEETQPTGKKKGKEKAKGKRAPIKKNPSRSQLPKQGRRKKKLAARNIA